MKLALVAALLAVARPGLALEVPFLSGRIIDDAHLIDTERAQSLERTLQDFESKTGHQIVVLTLPSLEGEVLEDFTLKVARTWKLGRKDQNDGILVFVARDDRKMRIEVGYGLEGALPDAAAGRIIRDRMVPRFRAGDFAGGIEDGVNAAIGTLDGTYSPPLDEPRGRGRSRNDFEGLGLGERIMASIFVFGILGLFEFVGVAIPDGGWFLYFFLIPFWSAFPMAIWGLRFGFGTLGAHLVLFPLARLLLPRTAWGKKRLEDMRRPGSGWRINTGSSWSGGSSGWSSGGSSGGFSGGGGSFGGGGSSGSW